jgi:hypothetical protein
MQIEVPFMANRTLSANIHQGVGTHPIVNSGNFNLPAGKNFHIQQQALYDLLDKGQAFLVNNGTHHRLLESVNTNENGSIEWHSKYAVNDFLRNALSAAMNYVEPQGQYVYHSPSEAPEKASEPAQEMILEKHQIKLEIQLDKDCLYPKECRIALHIIDSNGRQYMKHVMDVFTLTESKVFTLEQGQSFEVYPVREHMQDVKQDYSQNKHYQASIQNGRIQMLTVDRTDQIGGIQQHIVKYFPLPILRMGCFFDGTGNDDADPVKFSNIKLLSDLYSRRITSLPKSYAHGYVRGVGTEGDGLVGSLLGGAAGIGALKRVAGMIYEIEEAVKLYRKQFHTYPDTINLDIFGFSRGATTARHFMNVIKQGFYGFNNKSIQRYVTPDTFKISFAGLFDSVGSYGIAGDNDDYGYNFHIQPSWLTDAGQVIHLIALNEYRKNFDLQTLFEGQSRSYPMNMSRGKLQEIGLIGAHSDIGGGYEPNTQGIINDTHNPTQLSVMALKKMYDLASTHGVPLAKLPIQNIESNLEQHYTVVSKAILDPKVRRLWMEWTEHHKRQEISEERLQNTSQRKESAALRRILNNAIQNSSSEQNRIKRKLISILGQPRTDEFFNSFEYLDQHYIHESHSPFNSGIGMSPELDESNQGVRKLTRTIFFKPAVDFKQRNKELDRIQYRRGTPRKVDIDEFDFVMAKAFK